MNSKALKGKSVTLEAKRAWRWIGPWIVYTDMLIRKVKDQA